MNLLKQRCSIEFPTSLVILSYPGHSDYSLSAATHDEISFPPTKHRSSLFVESHLSSGYSLHTLGLSSNSPLPHLIALGTIQLSSPVEHMN